MVCPDCKGESHLSARDKRLLNVLSTLTIGLPGVVTQLWRAELPTSDREFLAGQLQRIADDLRGR